MKPQSSDNGGLDALLGRWPALDPQAKGGLSWEERADKIVTAVLARKEQGTADAVEALLAAPPLEAEPGEEKAASFQFDDGATGRDERALRPAAQMAGGAPQPMSKDQPSQSKRPSLKELAARASQSGAGRASVTSLPQSTRTASTPPSAPATVTPISKAKAARAADAGHEDSGVSRLADLQANEATKAEAAAAAAEAALASAAAKRDEDRKVAAAATVVQPAAASSGKSATGMWAGVTVAVLGLAAAFAIYKTRQPETAPTTTAQTETSPQKTPAIEAPKPQAVAEATVTATAEPAPVASTAASEAPKVEDPKGDPGAAAPTAVAAANADVKAAPPAGSTNPGSKVGTLDEEMKKAVGANELKEAPQDDGSKPASGGASGNIPEQPSQGNAQAAIRAVIAGARACVAGAPEPSSANVTFSSSGAVQSVSVGGWAAANGKAGCVKSALQGARVSPFAKASFTAPVTIRP